MQAPERNIFIKPKKRHIFTYYQHKPGTGLLNTIVMNKNTQTIANQGTHNLKVDSKSVSFNIDLKYEQCKDQKGSFRVTVLMGRLDDRFSAGHFLVSISQFGTIGSWVGCEQFDAHEKRLIEETIVAECKGIYAITSMSQADFLMAL